MASRPGDGEDKLYVMLFDYIESASEYDEKLLLRKNTRIKKEQLSNIKANLLRHILEALRQFYSNTQADMEIRQLLDHARIYQLKGMTAPVLETLARARRLAYASHQTVLLYHVMDEERIMETQYITGSSSQKALKINEETTAAVSDLALRDRLSNLSIMLYGMYLKNGYVRTDMEFGVVRDFFRANLPAADPRNLGFYEKVYYYQSLVWFHHMTQNFAGYYKYSQKWVDSFHDESQMIHHDPLLYLKGLHNTLNALYMANRPDKFLTRYGDYVRFGESLNNTFPESYREQYTLFSYVHRLNVIFLTGDYKAGVRDISDIAGKVWAANHSWDQNREVVFCYKVACVYFGADDYSRSLDYLNMIISKPVPGLRNDIHCFARILSLISHYELRNDLYVSYMIKSVFRFLRKMENLQAVLSEVLDFLKRSPGMDRKNLTQEFMHLRSNRQPYKNDPYERRPFLYLDIIAWLDSKITGVSISEIIRNRIAATKKSDDED